MGEVQESGLGRALVKGIRAMKGTLPGNCIMASARIANALLDGIMTTMRNKGLAVDVLIYDRYFYDVLACLLRDHPKARPVVWAVLRMMPRPEVPVFLTAPAALTVERKHEHTVDSAQKHIEIYDYLARELDVLQGDTRQTVESIQSNLRARVETALATSRAL